MCRVIVSNAAVTTDQDAPHSNFSESVQQKSQLYTDTEHCTDARDHAMQLTLLLCTHAQNPDNKP